MTAQPVHSILDAAGAGGGYRPRQPFVAFLELTISCRSHAASRGAAHPVTGLYLPCDAFLSTCMLNLKLLKYSPLDLGGKHLS